MDNLHVLVLYGQIPYSVSEMDDVKFSILGLHIQEAHIVTFALLLFPQS